MKKHGALSGILLLAGAVIVSGCSAGEQTLGVNSRTEVFLESSGIDALRLVIAPQEGLPNDPDACAENRQGTTNCTREFPGPFTTLYRFDTTSAASQRPYYVYVINDANERRQFSLEIIMDNNSKLNRSLEIPGGEVFLVARIFRNNADRP